MRLFEDIIIHDTLNPKLWDVETKKLLPEVKEKIIQVCKEFEEYIEVPIDICDIQLVGSNCSFNWHDGSDLDVHIIANYESITDNTELLDILYNSKKAQFNSKYNITIHGVEIEMYIQNVKAGITSNGIYSICDNEWIKEPKPIKSIKNYDNSEAFGKWKMKIEQVIKAGDEEGIKNTISMLYLMRRNSIAADGEYGQGNQLFKDIRNEGLIADLKAALDKVKSKELSLEGYSKGELVNRM